MKKLLFVLLLLALTAALTAPAVAERASQGETLSEMGEDLRARLEEKGDGILSWLKDYFASHESGEIADHLRTIFQETEKLTDEELDAEIRAAAEGVSLKLNDAQVEWLRGLCRKYEQADAEELRRTVEDWKEKLPDQKSLSEAMEKLRDAGDLLLDATKEAGKLWDDSKDFLTNLKDIFHSFFG